MLLRYYVKNKIEEGRRKQKDNIAKLQYQIILSLYPMYPHPDSLKKTSSQKISELDRHQILLEEITWTLKETKTEQQISEN